MENAAGKKKMVRIEWQRLVAGREKCTCPRCGTTEQSLDIAIEKLKRIGIWTKLNKKTMGLTEFGKAPIESNRILINGLPLEYWLNAKTGKSKCCSVCGDNECRTVELDEKTYEAIPADLIIRACKNAVKNDAKEGRKN